jgi:hypothetical protein
LTKEKKIKAYKRVMTGERKSLVQKQILKKLRKEREGYDESMDSTPPSS